MAPESGGLSKFDDLVGWGAAPVREHLVAALVRGNEQANDAYWFSPHSDGYTYGTNRWRFNLGEVGEALSGIDGARQLNPRNSKMWIVGQAVFYPVCYAKRRTGRRPHRADPPIANAPRAVRIPGKDQPIRPA